jgi:DNA-binding CsgD family transcriptional regulator
MPPTRDPIAFVEACYELGASEKDWLANVAEQARPLMNANAVLAYHIDTRGGRLAFHEPILAGEHPDDDVVARVRSIGALYSLDDPSFVERQKARIHFKVVRQLLADPADRLLLTERKTYGPRWAYTLGAPGVRNLNFFLNHHIDGQGATFMVGSIEDKKPLSAPARVMFQRLGAHLKAGLRLRRRVREDLHAVDATPGGAILDEHARLVHAEGEAKEAEIRELLEHRAREVDRARAAKHGRDEDALAIWQGLVDGRWSLVERFDSDGRRFILAHKNPEDVVDPRGLTALESRVVGLAVRGYADKLIAYHLGVAEGTVSSQLSRAMRKLGVTSRVELVRVLGPFYPLRDDTLDAWTSSQSSCADAPSRSKPRNTP